MTMRGWVTCDLSCVICSTTCHCTVPTHAALELRVLWCDIVSWPQSSVPQCAPVHDQVPGVSSVYLSTAQSAPVSEMKLCHSHWSLVTTANIILSITKTQVLHNPVNNQNHLMVSHGAVSSQWSEHCWSVCYVTHWPTFHSSSSVSSDQFRHFPG